MAPIPIGLLIPGLESRKIVTFTMILLSPQVIRLVLTIVPVMIIVVFGVVVTPVVLLIGPLVVAAIALGLQVNRRNYNGNC